MGIRQYKYSDWRMLCDAGILVFMTLMFYIALITRQSDYRSWLFFCAIMLIIVGRASYVTVMYLIPCLKGKIALELDPDKLQLFIAGKLLFQIPRDVAYWKDISDIEYTAPYRGSPIISFTMNNGSVFGFRTKYIAGNDKDIYNTIMEYFNLNKE